MPHLLDLPWLWLFGALSLGIFAGWLTYLPAMTRWNERLAHIAIGAVAVGALLIIARLLPARYGGQLELGMVLAVVSAIGCYLLATSRWNDRPLDIGIGAAAVAALLGIASVVPARYGTRLDLAVVLAVVGAIGCFVGWALRGLADFVPPATGAVAQGGATASAATTGSYLFRDAFAGIGASDPYMRAPSMRATTGHGGPARVRTLPSVAALDRAPARGGYTFPETLPFADATTNRRQPEAASATGLRRHWTWRA